MASKRKVAQSVVDVILREAAHTTPEGRLQDMRAIASVILNRARRQHRTSQQVVSAYSSKGNRIVKQFDGYNEPIPEGAEKYRQLAERALRDIEGAGPITDAMYYRTPAAWQGYNPDPPFQQVLQTDGHIFKVDPANRPIVTTPSERAIRPDPEPPFTPRKQTPLYDRGKFEALPRGTEYSLMGQELLAPRMSASASATLPNAGRLVDGTSFWSSPSWQSYLFDFAQPADAPSGVQLPDDIGIILQPRPDRPDPIDTRSIRGREASRSAIRKRGSSDSVAPYARLVKALLGGGSARPFGAPQNGRAANGGRPDTVMLTRLIREMQQAGASADEIRQAIADYRRYAAGDRGALR